MKTYQLVFEELFNKNGKPDPATWTHAVGEKWANNESQCYTDSIEHCYIKDGKLNIIATWKDQHPCAYQSARIHTQGKKEFQYGKFIIRAKMPHGRGSWPAIWFLGSNIKDHVKWPLCGEIDLVEFSGNKPKSISSAIHTMSYNHRIHTDKGVRIDLKTASDAFHDYELEWTKDSLIFSIDGNPYMHVDKQQGDTDHEWPFDQPFYLIMNLAVGGWYGGEIVDEDLPYHLQIDSIKVYQQF